jgi:hypothetical protein
MYKVGKHVQGKHTLQSRRVSTRANQNRKSTLRRRANYQFTQFLDTAEKTYERLQASSVDPEGWVHTTEGLAFVESLRPSVKGYSPVSYLHSPIVKQRRHGKGFLVWLLLILQLLTGVSAEQDLFQETRQPLSTPLPVPLPAPMPTSTPSIVPVSTGYAIGTRTPYNVTPYAVTPSATYTATHSVWNPAVSHNVSVPKSGPTRNIANASYERVEQSHMKSVVDFVVDEIKHHPENVKQFIQSLESTSDEMNLTDMVLISPHNTVTTKSHSFFGVELVSRNQYLQLDDFLSILPWTDGIGLDIDMAILSDNSIRTKLTSKHGGKFAIFVDKSEADTKLILKKIFEAAEQNPNKLIVLRVENNNVSASQILSNLPEGAADRLYVRDRFRQEKKKDVLKTGKNVMILLERDYENEGLHIDTQSGNYKEVPMMSQKYHTYRTLWSKLEVLPTPQVTDIMLNADVELLDGTYPFLIVDAYKSITGTDYSKIKKSLQIIPDIIDTTIPTLRDSTRSGVFRVNGREVQSHFTLGSGAFIMADMVSPSFYMMAKVVNMAIASNDMHTLYDLVTDGAEAFAAAAGNEIPNIALNPVLVDFFINVIGKRNIELREGSMIAFMTLFSGILYMSRKNKWIQSLIQEILPVVKVIIVRDLTRYITTVGSNFYPVLTNIIHGVKGGAKRTRKHR